MKVALITGVSGQDGSFLSEFLLNKGYTVFGLVRQTTQFTPDRYGHLANAMTNPNFRVVYGDVTDALRMRQLVQDIQPTEIYNLAAQSHVGVSFSQPVNTCQVTALGALNILDAIRGVDPTIKFYQAGSSEQFGKVAETPQRETTRFHPRSPYGVAKVFAHNMTVNYREAYNIFAVNGILFNHEGTRRGEDFVTRKITRAVGKIALGIQKTLILGNTDARRDWGDAEDYVEAMWLMLQNDSPKDYVIGTGETHSVQEFVEAAFRHARIDHTKHVETTHSLHRPSEVDTLCSDPSLARAELGWSPKTTFEGLVRKMVDHDIELARKERLR